MLPIRNNPPWFETVEDKKRFPKLSDKLKVDVAIVGGGIVGVMCAWILVARGLRVALLTKNHLATGDTGFTTAFLTRVPDTSLAKLSPNYDLEYVKKIFSATSEAQSFLKQTIADQKIGCDFKECFSFYSSYTTNDPILKAEWDIIKKVDARAYFMKNPNQKDVGKKIKEAIKFEGEGRFDIRKFIFGLLSTPAASEIQIFEESEVTELDISQKVSLKTQSGSVEAEKLVVASGLPLGFFSDLQGLFTPATTFAIAAKYEDKAPFSDNIFWDTDEPYQYYRHLNSQTVILGGADRVANTQVPPSLSRPSEFLSGFLNARFAGKFSVTHSWSGRLFSTTDGLPYASPYPKYKDKVFIASGFGGNGMVMGTLAAMIISDLIANGDSKFSALFDFSRKSVRNLNY